MALTSKSIGVGISKWVTCLVLVCLVFPSSYNEPLVLPLRLNSEGVLMFSFIVYHRLIINCQYIVTASLERPELISSLTQPLHLLRIGLFTFWFKEVQSHVSSTDPNLSEAEVKSTSPRALVKRCTLSSFGIWV
jgi:hypothetical protein